MPRQNHGVTRAVSPQCYLDTQTRKLAAAAVVGQGAELAPAQVGGRLQCRLRRWRWRDRPRVCCCG